MADIFEFADGIRQALRSLLREPPTDLIWLAPNDLCVEAVDAALSVSLPPWASMDAIRYVGRFVGRMADREGVDVEVGEPALVSNRPTLVAELRAPAMCP